MAWDDLGDLEHRLLLALQRFDWEAADVWSSPVEELDATFLDFAEDLPCEPIPLCPSPMEMADPAPRMFIIGHPGGRDLEFSLNDNRLVASNSQKLHYRTLAHQPRVAVRAARFSTPRGGSGGTSSRGQVEDAQT